MDPQACAAFGRIRLFLSDLQLVLGGLATPSFYAYGPMPTSHGKPTRRSRAWMQKQRTAPIHQAQKDLSCTRAKAVVKPLISSLPPDKASEGLQQLPTEDAADISRSRQLHRSWPVQSLAATKPWPTQIQMTRDSTLQACPRFQSIHTPSDNLRTNDGQNDIVSGEQTQSEAETEVKIDVGSQNQTFDPAECRNNIDSTKQSDYDGPSNHEGTEAHDVVDIAPGIATQDTTPSHTFLISSKPIQDQTESNLVDPSLAANEPSQPQPISSPFPMPIAVPTHFPFFPVPPLHFHQPYPPPHPQFHYPYPPPPFQYQQPLPPHPHSPDVQPTHPHPQSPEVVDSNSEPDHQTSFSDYNDNDFEHDYPEHHHEDNDSDHFEQHNLNSTHHFDDPNNQFDDQQYDCGDDDGGGDTFEYEEEDYNNYDYYDD